MNHPAIICAAEAFGVAPEEVCASGRIGREKVRWARQVACWLIRQDGQTFDSCAEAIGYAGANRLQAAFHSVGEVEARLTVKPHWNKEWNAALARAKARYEESKK